MCVGDDGYRVGKSHTACLCIDLKVDSVALRTDCTVALVCPKALFHARCHMSWVSRKRDLWHADSAAPYHPAHALKVTHPISGNSLKHL